jgi:hypothetical protein
MAICFDYTDFQEGKNDTFNFSNEFPSRSQTSNFLKLQILPKNKRIQKPFSQILSQKSKFHTDSTDNFNPDMLTFSFSS